MKSYIKRLVRLLLGLTLCGVGVAVGIQANIGAAPWDVLNLGLAKTTSISYGQANIAVGLAILVLSFFMKEKIGIGTIFNILTIASVVDFLFAVNIIPLNTSQNVFVGLVMMTVGLFINAFGIFLYIGAGLGSGPRDGLMVAMKKRLTKVPVGLVRIGTELCAVVAGWALGGHVGFGTLYAAVAGGFAIQMVFNLFHFKVNELKVEFADDTIRTLYGMLKGGTVALPVQETVENAPAELAPKNGANGYDNKEEETEEAVEL